MKTSKRKSQEPLEVFSTDASPTSKKARVEDVPEEVPTTSNGWNHAQNLRPLHANGADDTENGADEWQDEDVESDVEDDRIPAASLRQTAPTEGYDDLYLDTINRSLLDFDFEKLCSVTLSNINIYACLVCGKYFQGRGSQSQAYQHALELDHHVFINMETKKVYVLPEGYEVKNKSLDDIKFVVDPKYTEEEVKLLDKTPKESVDLVNKRYRPGFIGMNNIKANDYLNVVVQALAHVTPLREFFLLQQFPYTAAQLPVRFSTLVRKLWNPRAFRSHVSPHELLQEIGLRSSKKFTLTQQSDPVELLTWLLNSLHGMLGGSRKSLVVSDPSMLPGQITNGITRNHRESGHYRRSAEIRRVVQHEDRNAPVPHLDTGSTPGPPFSRCCRIQKHHPTSTSDDLAAKVQRS